VVLEEGFDAGRCADLLRKGEVTFASVVPTQLRWILARHPGPYEGVRAVLVGGGPIDPLLVERARSAGLPVLPTYGSTEACSQVATNEGDDPATAGRPLEGFEVRVDDGEIQIRGPAVFSGYVDESDRSPDEWHRTGDLGAIDDQGRLLIIGRADAVVVSGGENVPPGRVESVLLGHPAIDDVAVSGRPDPEWGNVVVADVVVSGARSFDADQVADFARRRLAGFEIPREWRIVDAIDRDEVGKRRAT
jgi:O-succinylbenzoic acid--CoA ligase